MDTKKIILFIILSFSILMLWEAWQKEKHPSVQQPQLIHDVPQTTKAVAPIDAGLLQNGKLIKVKTDNLYVEVDTVGGDIRLLELRKLHDSHDKTKNYTLLENTPKSVYVAQSGLLGFELPTHKSEFSSPANSYSLLAGQEKIEVPLEWSGADGVHITKTLIFHRDGYLVDVKYQIHNGSSKSIFPNAYFQLLRSGEAPKDDPRFISTFTGPAFYSEENKFHKIQFKNIVKGDATIPPEANNGWVAMLQHYFLSAWLPSDNAKREFYAKRISDNLYVAGLVLNQPFSEIKPGETKEYTASLYAGPQEQVALSHIAKGLDLTVDYGWLTVLSAPIYWALEHIHKLVGNWGFSIILLTILIKLAFFPLSAKSYRSMAHMRHVGPKLQKIKEQYGDDRQRMHQAMMELYKTEKINPLGGCLPVVVQIPVFIALYWVLLYSVEIRQSPFVGWITDLSTADPYYVLPVLMGITMLIQTRLNPTPPDPVQAKVMMLMPIAMTFFFMFFPAGLVLYWIVNNLISISQQWVITRRLEASLKSKK